MTLIFLLVIGEEKHLVYLDRAVERGAKLVESKLFGGCGEEAARVQ